MKEGMNPNLFSNTFFIVVAIIFFIILYDELQREMGWKVEKEYEFISFESRVRNEDFVLPPTFPVFCTYCNIVFRYVLIRL